MTDTARLESAALQQWLNRLEQRSPEARIKLGLERVQQVLDRLAPDFSDTKIITVGGTNGKGSTVRFLESIYTTAGYRCLAYTSPHLLEFAERFRLDGENLADDRIVEALDVVERTRGEIVLTYFEHVTLAAFYLAGWLKPAVLLLEVGLGGRLDAVNAVDADVAIITSIGLDHQAWLGNTRAEIAYEKAGIARVGKPLLLMEKQPPEGMLDTLTEYGADIHRAGWDLNWRWTGALINVQVQNTEELVTFTELKPGLPGRHQAGNVTAAIAAALELLPSLPVSKADIYNGIAQARLAGRFQQVLEHPPCYIDVAHNPASVRALRAQLDGFDGTTRAVFAAFRDKNIAAMIRSISGRIDHWYVAGLNGPRGQSGNELNALFETMPVHATVDAVKSVPDALELALADARRAPTAQHERIVVFGSFITAAIAIRHLKTPTG
ncbi:MAG: folylpolyglutamate synthase/dihydrofolate synthase family protein [Pseudomonadota bacterium]